MPKRDETDIGSISEWNEGNLKNLRLHEAQEWINAGKISPFDMTDDKTKFNFEIWKGGIDILFGEGSSKYSDDEIKEVQKLKQIIELLIELKPAVRKETEYIVNRKKDKFVPLKSNQENIRKFLESYELKVRSLNNTHGLDTRNKDEDDTKGL